ncbi:MAG: hypothetical protein M9927_03950 [Anaerolineae bacterium]|nr:hypothetical protein [Anaerolineae bacterium]
MTPSSLVFKPTRKRLAIFLGPGILLYGFMVIVPILGAFRHSLYTDFNFQFRFVGVQNYVEMLTDGDFWFSFRNNLIILGLSLLLQISLAFVIAVMMNSRLIRFAKFSRAVMFFPVILSAVVVGFISGCSSTTCTGGCSTRCWRQSGSPAGSSCGSTTPPSSSSPSPCP